MAKKPIFITHVESQAKTGNQLYQNDIYNLNFYNNVIIKLNLLEEYYVK